MPAHPADWPVDGYIDLAIHDLPHQSATTEWWYVNSHLETTSGRHFSLFASFFRLVTGEQPQTKSAEYAHSVTWAISDLEEKKYYVASCIDPRAPEIIRKQLDSSNSADKLTKRAMREVVDKGTLPRPDRLINAPISIDLTQLALNYGGDCFDKDDNGVYHLELFDEENQVSCNLTFRPLIQPVRHGENGEVRGISNEGMFYYFIPHCVVEGVLIIDGTREPVTIATGWYDHEFGHQSAVNARPENADQLQAQNDQQNIAWNWISIQLDNNWALSAYDLFNTDSNEGAGRWAILIDPDGNAHQYTAFTFEPLNSWTSLRTFNSYPIHWKLLMLSLRAKLDGHRG